MASSVLSHPRPPDAPSSLVVRRAVPADDAGRQALLAAVAMKTDLSLSVRRAPDVDAMYALHGREWEGWVVADDVAGRVEGMGSIVIRDGYVGGAVVPVGYLGDLRFSARAEGRMLLDRTFGPILEEASARHGCRHYLTAIITSNERARRALTVQTARAAARGRPRYTLLREFDIRSLHLVLPHRRPRSRYAVRLAREADIPAVAALLDADARRRPFGYPMPEAELRRRLREWPGLSIDAFHLCEDTNGRLVGVLARWDASPVKQTVVEGYSGRMGRVRTIHDLAARVLGRPRLPRPGEPMHYQYVTHLAVPSDEPAILSALLHSAHTAARREGFHFLSVPAPVGDPLGPAYRGYPTTDIRAALYVVTLPGTAVPDDWSRVAMPGFEMALT